MQQLLLPFFIFFSVTGIAQKKALDHSVYDNWKSIGEKMISNNGQFVVYAVNPQEGDGELIIQNPTTKYKKVIPRGYSATITEDSRFVVFKIKPLFKDTRQAKIKKKKGEELPKDSLGIIELGQDSVVKIAQVKSYKTPEKGAGWLVYEMEKNADTVVIRSKASKDSLKQKKDMLLKLADSVLKKAIDSLNGDIKKEDVLAAARKAAKEMLNTKDAAYLYTDAEGDDAAGGSSKDGSQIVIRKLGDTLEKRFTKVSDYLLDNKGTKLLIETVKNGKDSNSKAYVLLYDLAGGNTDTVMNGFNDCKNFSFDEEGRQLAFTAERDSSEKALQKFYKLWYYKSGLDSAILIADKNTAGMQLGYTVSENSKTQFSKNGTKLFFGNAPIRSPKDTTLVDFETAKLDIWNYKDDYLQTQQLKNLDAELKRTFTAVYNIAEDKIMQLGAEDAEKITLVNEGNANWVLAESNKGNRVEMQWDGKTKNTAYIINVVTGEKKPVFKNLYANAEPSPAGKFVYWYNLEAKNYFTYEVATGITRNVTEKIKVPLYDEENDVPDFADPYGVMGWYEDDNILYVYDKYGVWNLDPVNDKPPYPLLENAAYNFRKEKTICRYINTDKESRFIKQGKELAVRFFNTENKQSGYGFLVLSNVLHSEKLFHLFTKIDMIEASLNGLLKAKDSLRFVYTKETFSDPANIYYDSALSSPVQLSDINLQQKNYNWGTAELFKWKTYNGKETTGILYKPEDFDPKKKYPLICYFYEKYSDNLYSYVPPAPTPSRLNISFFVSRGYIVLAPDISYTIGYPGKSAYDYIVSGARAVVKKGFIDSTKIGLQGQSWGGYQVAYLITKTKLFKAAWAGAPVANMTSAYGGIRWESGLNRQFQYEKSQSRIGATLWEKPQLYIENSPLFHLPKVQTPLVIMSNDADGAVPWYQGIELFTALRRLGKPVWMLNYNGEAHNLVERRNRKDIQIREQQFFDWLLKGEKPPKWITEGVPATEKGKDWGLGLD
ncbi:MAG: prolyl oligopeptidase family serine peptidase [Ferruginibacter sp.]